MRQKSKRWYELQHGQRLAHDRALIAASYPALEYRIDDALGQVYLEGLFTLVADCGVRTHIEVQLKFPGDYPKSEPRVYDIANRFPHIPDRHFFANGQCCLWLEPESRWNKDDCDALIHFLPEVAVFFDRQLVFDAEGTGIWPGPERGHGIMGFVEFVQELVGDTQLLTALTPTLANVVDTERNAPCPCGSGRKYKHCHLSLVELITRRVGLVRTREVFRGMVDKVESNRK